MSGDVIGFITPCDVCGRKAITQLPLDNYVCPSCAELGGFGDIDVAQADPLAAPTGPTAVIPIYAGHITYKVPVQEIDGIWWATGPGRVANDDEDDYPIGKVQG